MLVLLQGGFLPVAAAPEVCVLAPHLERSASPHAVPRALVALSRPTLFVREPLAELRIEEGAQVLWRWQSLPNQGALEGPLAWPLSPLKPGQAITVHLRPLGSTPEHFATIQLEGAPLQRLREGDGRLRSLMGQPGAWRPAIEDLLAKGDQALATALLFANEGPNDPDLNALRLLVAQESCQ
ncbi:MAG: hypothetical protein ACKO45_12780 [Cyanobium sp.]